MNDTIDTLKIKVEGEDQSAGKTLDKLISTLERIKGLTQRTNIGSLTSELKSIKNSVDSINTKNLLKLRSEISAINNSNKSNLQLEKLRVQAEQSVNKIEDLTNKIHDMNNTFSEKPTELMQRLIDKENELETAAKRVKDQITGTTPQPLVEKYTKQYDDIRRQIEQISNQQLNLTENGKAFNTVAHDHPRAFEQANNELRKEQLKLDDIIKQISKTEKETRSAARSIKSFGKQVKSAFSETPVGRFAKKVKNEITSICRMAIARAIRFMLKQVTDSFKTGIDDMYQYSKTFNGEYAQSMDRLASANLSFKNSIGAIMAPLIELVTPWLDSFVDKLIEINNTIAMVLAGLAGKTTYSKAVRVTTEYAQAANKAADNTGKVKDRVEELKRSLASLDEITIIGQNLSPISAATSGNDAISNGLDYGSMFVETPVDMAKVNEIKEKFEKILEIAQWIGIAIGAWSLGKFIGSLAQAITGVTGLKNKIALGLTLMVTGFSMEWSGGYHIGYGDAGTWDYIKAALGAALGIGGSLLVFGTGPLGWTIGITAALTVFLASVSVGASQRLSDLVEQAFYDAGGTITISDLAGQFERYCRAIINTNQPTVDLGKQLDDIANNIVRPAAEDILSLGRAVILSEWDAEKYMPQIIEQITNLQSGTQDILDKVYDNIVRAVSGSLFDSLTEAGVYVPELLDVLAKVKGETDKTVEDAITRMQELSTEFSNGKISSEEYYSQLEELTTQITNLTGVSDPAKDALDKMTQSVAGIDWENKSARDTAFAKISDTALEAKDSINEAFRVFKEEIDIAKTWSDDPIYQDFLEKVLIAKESERDRQLAELRQYTSDFMGQVQDDLILKMKALNETLNPEHLFDASTNAKVAKGLQTYRDNIINPLTDGINDLYANLGITGKAYASEAASNIISGMYEFTSAGTRVNRNIWKYTGTSFEDSLRNTYEGIGRSVPDGLVAGMNSRKGVVTQAVDEMIDTFLNTATDSQHLDSHSPSKATERIGRDAMLGFSNGFMDNQRTVISSIDNCLNAMLSRLETFANRWRSGINQLFDDMAYSWKNADFRSDGSYSYQRLSSRSIPRFAQGGFPEDGFFYANHDELVGQFSNGKTAVANNEQIVEGIAGGVAAANEQQNTLLREQNRLLRMLLEKDSTIDVSTIASAFNRKNQRDGKVTVPVAL